MRILSLFISAFILFSTSVSAEQKEVKLYTIDILSPKGPNSGIPIVQEDGNDITISCDTTLYNVDIVIRDLYGNVMHHSVENIGPIKTTIFVPEDNGSNPKATIDLYYDRKHFSGDFNE